MTLDDIDRRLIALLRDNARLPVASLAQHLGVSRGTVQNRMRRLQRDGWILGYTTRLKGDEAAVGVRAVTLVQEEAKHSGRVAKALRAIPQVKAVYTTNGRWDIMAEVVADTLAELDDALSAIRGIHGVTVTETLILLTAHKS